jgi:hypothetical protein
VALKYGTSGSFTWLYTEVVIMDYILKLREVYSFLSNRTGLTQNELSDLGVDRACELLMYHSDKEMVIKTDYEAIQEAKEQLYKV